MVLKGDLYGEVLTLDILPGRAERAVFRVPEITTRDMSRCNCLRMAKISLRNGNYCTGPFPSSNTGDLSPMDAMTLLRSDSQKDFPTFFTGIFGDHLVGFSVLEVPRRDFKDCLHAVLRA